MEIYTYLKKDHQKVNNLFEQLIAEKNMDKTESLFEALREELLLHAESEQKTFYKALKRHPETKDEARHGDKEHAQIEDYLWRLEQLSCRSDEWLVLLGELKRTVAHHVRDEENTMFKKARKVLTKDQAENLVEEMDALKQKILNAAEDTED
jgi:hemerythrin superfamily protein